MEAGRAYMSIGEVINVLKDEFSDVTVSKIRFLESEGLVHPERTPSGYRKFSGHDIERLRIILRAQRDQFLPLKVIRERLDEWEAAGGAGGGQSTLSFDAPADEPPAPSMELVEQPAPVPAPEPDPFDIPLAGLSLSRDELAAASGLSDRQLDELGTYGLLTPKDLGDGELRYTDGDLEIAKLSRDLIELGLEPRHLRLFRSSVDRWASLAEQMVMPLIKQRNPDARRAAADTIRDLVRVGSKLQTALLREALSAYA